MNTPLKKLLEITWLKFVWTIKSELLLLILVISLFFNLTSWLRAIDATAAPLDPGILMAPAVGLVSVVAAILFFWVLVKAIFTVIDRWFDGEKPADPNDTYISFNRDWNRAGPAVRLACFFTLFATVILAVAGIAIAVR